MQERLQTMPEFQRLSPEQQTQILQPFSHVQTTLATQALIAVVRENLRRFEEEEYPKLLTRLTSLKQPETMPLPPKPGQLYEPKLVPEKVAEPKIEYIANRAIQVPFAKAWLSNENDVEAYFQSAREAFLQEIRKGKRIQV